MRAILVLFMLLVPALPASARPLDEAGAGEKPAWWDWTTISPGELGLGGGELTDEEVAYLDAQGFRAVLSVREEREDPVDALAEHGFTYLRIPLGDAEHDTLDVEEMQEALDFIDAQIAEGRPVYVHCIAGWHRSAAIVAAWLMVRDGTDAETAWDALEDLRPKVEPRWIDAVYAYEAHLAGRPKLDVDVHVGAISPHVGDPVRLEALVTLGGVPVEGAEIHLEAEYDEKVLDTVTDADGRASVEFVFDGDARQYVHALARVPDAVPGYDRATLYGDGSRKQPGPYALTVDRPAAPLAPGAPVALALGAVGGSGKPYNVRVTVADGERTLWRGYLGHPGEAEAALPAATTPGEHALTVRATSPYADTFLTEVAYVVAGEPVPPDTGGTGPRETLPSGLASVPKAAPGGALVGVAAVALAAALRRRCGGARGLAADRFWRCSDDHGRTG